MTKISFCYRLLGLPTNDVCKFFSLLSFLKVMKLNMSLFLLNKESIASTEYENKAVVFRYKVHTQED